MGSILSVASTYTFVSGTAWRDSTPNTMQTKADQIVSETPMEIIRERQQGDRAPSQAEAHCNVIKSNAMLMQENRAKH